LNIAKLVREEKTRTIAQLASTAAKGRNYDPAILRQWLFGIMQTRNGERVASELSGLIF
jgi:hypothetical protein